MTIIPSQYFRQDETSITLASTNAGIPIKFWRCRQGIQGYWLAQCALPYVISGMFLELKPLILSLKAVILF